MVGVMSDQNLNSPGIEAGSASFGFREVPAAEKAGLVRSVFERVASRYDLMNDVMSLGVHRIWKKIFITRLNLRPGEALIDVAGGTGDIARLALAHARYHARRNRGPAAHVDLVDINEQMIRAGIARGDHAGISWSVGDAEKLGFGAKTFDAYTIAFGIRNVTHLDQALAEARRVLKPGGRFLCLEFSDVNVPGLDRFYDAYSLNAIPKLGAWIANDGPAYQYLVESIRRFPGAEDFAARIKAAGFANVGFNRLSGGIAAIHTGWRI
jgi:demethylmenaquinone methyltransferase / 2-methoxy-6-polyprenyl-1,4-benzoquinol methylase